VLQIHFANRAEALRERLLQQLEAEAPGVFDATPVIVPSAALQRWLTLALARRHGVCANIGFAYLARWLWQQIAQVVPGVAERSPFDPAVLAWRVYAAFGDAGFRAGHPRLDGYLAAADPLMRLDLAETVAGLLDQTITYRPDWLDAWSRGGVVDLGAAAHADQAWQAALWRRVAAEVGAAAEHPALALVQALDDARRAGRAVPGLPPSVHVFCLPTMAPLHLGMLQALAQHAEVHVYALNPCREYWFEVVAPRRLAWLAAHGRAGHHETGQRLLAAWGAQAQSHLGLLVDAGGDGVVDDALFEALPGTHLLARLHNAVLAMHDPAAGEWPLAADDRSIELHVCHSLTRELEVLHDTLLALFASPQAPASLADVLVVLPDLDAAAPLIDAVFGTAPRERFIPYTVTGGSGCRANPVARVLLELLALADSRLPVSEVLALLQQPMVARRFGFDADALAWLRDALRDAGVHWGLDASHQAACGLPANGRHTLADGLDRLFLGHALPDETVSDGGVGHALPTVVDGRLPAGGAEGADAATLGAWWSFVQALAAWQRALAAPLPVAGWPPLLGHALARFIAPQGDEIEDQREVAAAIEALAGDIALGAPAEALPLAVLRAALARAFDTPARGGVPTGTLSFSNIAALRGVPFEVVCLLGLNDGEFPGRARSAEFDLLALQPRRGDRQRRDDQRGLFLDLMLAARQRLHLSCVGRSIRDNAVLSPSVLVDELLDALVPAVCEAPHDAAALAAARARLVVEHPLQAFAAAAFRNDADPRQRSFRSDFAAALSSARTAAPVPAWRTRLDHAEAADETDDGAADDDDDPRAFEPPAAPFFRQPLPLPADAPRALTLGQLQRFLRNPCRALLQSRLGLVLRSDDDELLDDEPLVADGAARRALANRLLPALLAGAGPAAVRGLALAGVERPGGTFGRQWLDAELAGLHAFVAALQRAADGPLQPVHAATLVCDLDGERWRLDAAFADLRAGGLLRHRYAELSAVDRLDAWLQHLVLCASAPPGVAPATTWVARDGVLRLRAPADPLALLAALLRLYRRGLQQPLAFFPRSAWAYVDKGDSVNAALGVWRSSRFRRWAEGDDAACRLALRGRPDPFGDGLDAFHALAHAVFDPLREHTEAAA
jgi:exodeoxyribonuclease V gamma subunit